jgi:ribosomal-protein-alanine N-acetyltransferase
MSTGPIRPREIRTERLLLRQLTPDDAADLARAIDHELIDRTTLKIPHPYTLADAHEWIGSQSDRLRDGTGVNFAIILDDRLIGGVGLDINPGSDKAEMGYWITPAHWGNGYVTEAARAVLEFAFEDLGLHRVYADHFPNNPASGRVMLKIGMKPEGIRREHLKKGDVYHDAVCFGMLRTDWQGT